MSNEAKSALLAIGVPFVGVLGGIVALSGSELTVLGFPILFAWPFPVDAADLVVSPHGMEVL